MLVTIPIWVYILLMPLPYGWAMQMLISKWFKEPEESANLAVVWLLGLLTLTTLASVFSFFISINLLAHALLLAGAVIITFIWSRTHHGAIARWFQSAKAIHGLAWLLLGFAVLTTLEIATRVPSNPDTGLYHAQAIHWIENYPVVPGLGNLHSRLAFNSSWLVTNALFSFIFLGGQSFHLVASVLFLVVLFYSGSAASQLLKNGLKFSSLFKVFLLPVAFYVLASEVSSPGTDLPVTLIIWVVLAEWLTMLENNHKPSHTCAVVLFMITIYAVTIKLSSAPLVLVGVWLVFASDVKRQVNSLLKCAALGLMVALPWLGRNIIVSGYLIYPFPSIDLFKVDWKIPIAQAFDDQMAIQSWGKIPGHDIGVVAKMPLMQWFREWWANLTTFRRWVLEDIIVMPFILALYGVVSRTFQRASLKFITPLWPVYLVTYTGVAFWFFGSPDFRFGYGFLMAALFLSISPWFILLRNLFSLSDTTLASLLLVILIGFQAFTLYKSVEWRTLPSRLILPADYKSLPTAPCQLANAIVLQPDKDSWSECWYNAFPCTPKCNSNVTLRGTSWGDGFRYPP
jgi:hypothetical protein